MTEQTPQETDPQPPRAEFQFGLQAFLWMFVVVAVFLSYIRTFGPAAVAKFGLVATLALLIGGLIGLVAGRFSAAVFWSGIGVVGGYLPWCNAASPTGARNMSGRWWAEWSARRRPPAATETSGGGWICLARLARLVVIYDLSLFGFRRDLIADLICASVGGALAGLGVELASRFEKCTSIPRHFFALGLVILAIAGHWLAVRMIPGL